MENIIRSDLTTELHEILELYCELLLARTGLMESRDCDPGLEEAAKSIIYAAPRTDIKELQQTRQLLVEKYGKDFALQAMDNTDGKVAERVLKKLRVEPPDPELVRLYLKEIARTYGIPWPKEEHPSVPEGGDDDDEPSDGAKVKILEAPSSTEELSKATPPRDLGPRSPVHIAPPSPSTDNLNPKIKLPGPPELKPGAKMVGKKSGRLEDEARSIEPGGKKVVGGKIPDVDELAKRFAALKK